MYITPFISIALLIFLEIESSKTPPTYNHVGGVLLLQFNHVKWI